MSYETCPVSESNAWNFYLDRIVYWLDFRRLNSFFALNFLGLFDFLKRCSLCEIQLSNKCSFAYLSKIRNYCVMHTWHRGWILISFVGGHNKFKLVYSMYLWKQKDLSFQFFFHRGNTTKFPSQWSKKKENWHFWEKLRTQRNVDLLKYLLLGLSKIFPDVWMSITTIKTILT